MPETHDIRSAFAAEGAAIIWRMEAVLIGIAFYGLVSPLWSSHRWVALMVHAAVWLPTLYVMFRWLRRLRLAVSVVPMWGEGLSAGVRWGWRPSEPSTVLGPYCPTAAHTNLLTAFDPRRAAIDGDVVSEQTPLCCSQDPAERFDFRAISTEPTTVAAAREQVRNALQLIGVWKRAK